MRSMVAGMALGLSVALPFGPVSLVCLQRAMASGWKYGIASSLGATTAQAIFATIALTASGIVSGQLSEWQGTIRIVSSALLMFIGFRTLSRSRVTGRSGLADSLATAYVSTLALALTNPMTILPYLAVTSALASGGGRSMHFLPMVAGIVVGAGVWYAALSSGALLFSRFLGQAFVGRLNMVAGTALISFGAITAVGSF